MSFQIDCTGEPEGLVWPRRTGFAAALAALGVIVAPQITYHTTARHITLHDGSSRKMEDLSMWKLGHESITSGEDVKTNHLYHAQNAGRLNPDQKGLLPAEAAVTASLCAFRCQEFLYLNEKTGAPVVQVMGLNGAHPLASLRANSERWKQRAYDLVSLTEEPEHLISGSACGAHWRKRVFALVAVGFPLVMLHGGVPKRDENGGYFLRDANPLQPDLKLADCLGEAATLDAYNARGRFAPASEESIPIEYPPLGELPGYPQGCHLFHFAYQSLHCFDQLWHQMGVCASSDRSLFMQGQGSRAAILKLEAPDDELLAATLHTGVKL